jgi:hypothetical protein
MSYENVPEVMKLFEVAVNKIMKKKEKDEEIQILDVDPNWGKYGLMMRETIQKIEEETPEELKPVLQGAKIDAIEACKTFHSQLLKSKVYDHLFHGDLIEKISVANEKYDLVNLVNRLDRWSKKAGLTLIRKMIAAGKHIIVSVPKIKAVFEATDFEEFRTFSLPAEGESSHVSKLLAPEDEKN